MIFVHLFKQIEKLYHNLKNKRTYVQRTTLLEQYDIEPETW